MRGLNGIAGQRAGWAAAALSFAVLVGAPTAASAQQLSEKAVRTFMNYAWSLTPARFTKPDGTSVLIDKTKRSEVEIPVDQARDVIMAGRLTAHAQICELFEEQVGNYKSLMRREQGSGRWSDQQMIFINQLHLTTVMLLTGQIQVKQNESGEKDVEVKKRKSAIKTCTDEQRARVKKRVVDYLAAEPKSKKKAAKTDG